MTDSQFNKWVHDVNNELSYIAKSAAKVSIITCISNTNLIMILK